MASGHAKGSAGRRAFAALLLGAALAMGVGALAAQRPLGAVTVVRLAPGPQPSYSVVEVGGDERHGPRITIIAGGSEETQVAYYPARGAVCVRLCDGFFFPLDGAEGGPAAACNSRCPDAPTEVFYRGGSDRIEDAASARGARYSALPAALRYRKAADPACSCHRGVVSYTPLRDPTLRPGDAVMTAAGFLVFEGGARVFSALGQARMLAEQRLALQAMERASLADAPAAQPAAAPRVLARASLAEDKIRLLRWRGAED